jgi:hypothetical protein
MKKDTAKIKGGLARAKKLSPARRKEIAERAANARWRDEMVLSKINPPAFAEYQKEKAKEFSSGKIYSMRELRDEIAFAVLQGLYANLADSQKFCGAFFAGMPLPEAFTRIAYSQADETLRLRSL